MSWSLVEGWTEDVDYTLSIDGTAFNLTGHTVALQAKKQDGTVITLTGAVIVTAATTGKVRYNPSAGDILQANGPMLIRWKVTDGGGLIAYFPNGDPERWNVGI